MVNVLSVSNDRKIMDTLRATFVQQGYAFKNLPEIQQITAIISQFPPDLLVLDVSANRSDARAACRELRRNPALAGKPLLVITDSISPEEAAELFELGVDDLMRKPALAEKELAARVRALIRWTERPAYNRASRLKMLESQHLVYVNDRRVALTPIEFQLLNFLCVNRNRYFTAEELLEALWNYPPETGDTALVRNHIRNLRRKLEFDPDHPQVLISRYGQGYTVRAVVQQS
jgi:two-component system, OmpR family, response regulator RpaA